MKPTLPKWQFLTALPRDVHLSIIPPIQPQISDLVSWNVNWKILQDNLNPCHQYLHNCRAKCCFLFKPELIYVPVWPHAGQLLCHMALLGIIKHHLQPSHKHIKRFKTSVENYAVLFNHFVELQLTTSRKPVSQSRCCFVNQLGTS
jgi:hypothetical protein